MTTSAETATEPHRSPSAAPKTRGLVTTLAFAGITAALMQTLVTPLIATLPVIFDTSASNTAWIITATLLSAGVFVPIAGRLGDILGKRPMLIACTVPLIVGSIVCALAPSLMLMIIGRALQGMGMGMLPLGLAVLRDVLPREKLSPAIALVSATMGVGGAIGLPIAAAVAEFASWRVLFWGAAALAVVVAALIILFVPATPAVARGQRFDVPGAIGLGAGLVAVLLAVSKGGEWGWTSALTWGLIGGGVLLLVLWGWWETRIRDPLVDLRTTARPRVLMTNVASIFVGFGMYASMLVIPQLLQYPTSTGYGLGQSMLQAGLWMAPAGIMMMVLSPFAGRLTDRRGPKITLVVGTAIITLGYVISQPLLGTAWGLLVMSLVVNAGVAFAYGAMPTLIMSSVPVGETASANGFNMLMRSLGTTIGAAVVGVVLAENTVGSGSEALISEGGFRLALLTGGAIALIAVILAALIPGPRTKDDGPGRSRSGAHGLQSANKG
ncbi:MFS transporter [Microbacteriaceae bacterium VKM Ac-2855]|nr:MFS transporter [Microbacteriaceae bacterium VKM Ac-2855]